MPPRGESRDPEAAVLHFAFVDNLDEHRTELEAAGIDVLSYGPDEVENTVFIQVVLADKRTVAELERRYGEAIVVTGTQPVD